MQETLIAQNIKCGGCAAAIREGLLALGGVNTVEVDIASGRVTVEGPDLARDALAAELARLGYPEASA